MIDITANCALESADQMADPILIRKTIAACPVSRAAEKALDAVGGAGCFRGLGLERLVPDVDAAQSCLTTTLQPQ